MPRKIIPCSKIHPYHVSARCHNREWFNIPLEDVWKIFENYLFFIHHSFKIEILSFVLMSNHFHLLLKAPEGNLSEAMRYFLGETSRQIGRSANRINQTYGTRFSRSLIHSHHYYLCAYKYVYRNPVKAEICERVEEYRYSSLAILLGQRKSVLPLSEDLTLFSDFEGTMKWLNTKEEDANYRDVKKALRKSEFDFTPNRNTGSPHPLTQILY